MSRIRWGTPLTLVACVLSFGLAACDDDPTSPNNDVYGVWELDEPEELYLHIRTGSITVYDEDPAFGCFDRFVIDIIDRDGDFFLLDDGAFELEAEIRRIGRDGLYIALQGDDATYTWAGHVDPGDDLDIC